MVRGHFRGHRIWIRERHSCFQRMMDGNFSMSSRAKMLEKMGLKKGWTKKDCIQAKELTFFKQIFIGV